MPYNCPHCEKPNDDAVPKSRFDEVYGERRALKAELTEATKSLEAASATATNADDLTARVAELEGQLTNQSSAHTRAVAAMGAGVTDPEDVADLLAIFDRRAPEGVSLSDWLAERDSLPRSAAALLSTSTPATAVAAAPVSSDAPPVADVQSPATLGTPAPPADAGAVPHTAAPAAYTPQAISNMTTAEYREKRAAILNGSSR